MPKFTKLFRSQSVLMGLIYCSLIIGTIWQMYYISTVYFTYDTSVTVITEIPEYMTVPAVTICIRNLRWLSREKLLEKYPDTMQSTNVSDYLRNCYDAATRTRLTGLVLDLLIKNKVTISELNALGKSKYELISPFQDMNIN